MRAITTSHEVIPLFHDAGDIADAATLSGIAPVDHVFHLAARTFVPDSWKDPAGFLDCNVIGTANVLKYCRRASASLTFVSAYVYGKPQKLPLSEDDIPKPNNPYALSKYLAEQLCEFAARSEGLRVTVVRPFNVYGPGQPERFLIPTVISQVKAGVPVRVLDLTPKRDYVHVDDLVNLLVTTLTRKDDRYCLVNAGSSKSYSVKEVVDIVQEAAGTSLPVIDEKRSRHEELDDVRADISLAGKWFGWAPKIPLKTGIARILASADNSQ